MRGLSGEKLSHAIAFTLTHTTHTHTHSHKNNFNEFRRPKDIMSKSNFFMVTILSLHITCLENNGFLNQSKF